MGLLDTIQSAAVTAITATGDIPKWVYYRDKGVVTYDPVLGRQTEAGAVDNVIKVDISVDATNSQFNSVSTDFTTMGFSTSQYVKVSGFTTAGNNGFFIPTLITATSITISGLTLTDEVAGDTIKFEGPFYRFKGIKVGFRAKEKDNDAMIDSDQKILVPKKTFPAITPRQHDRLWIDNDEWVILRLDTDPAEALFIIRIRNWKFYKENT